MTVEQIPSRREFRAFAIRLTHNEDHARDLLQDTAYLVLKHQDNFQEGTNFVAWVKTIIRHAFINGYQKKKRRAELVKRDQPQGNWLGDRVTGNQAESSMEVEEIMAQIDLLDERYRKPLMLHLQGNKYREISRLTGMPTGTAKSRVFTAKKLLRTQLRQCGIDWEV